MVQGARQPPRSRQTPAVGAAARNRRVNMARAPARRAANLAKFGPGSAGDRKVMGPDPQHDYTGDNKGHHGSPKETHTIGPSGGRTQHFGSAPGAPPAPHLGGPQAGP